MIRYCRLAALAALMVAPAGAQEPRAPRPVMVVVAHPDDELTMAPALAALARQGRMVTILFATTGDQGPGVTTRERGAELGAVRRADAECSARALGAQVRFLEGLGDGTLAQSPQSPDAPARRFLAQFAQAYVDIEPELVLTWGPDGGYGHADHRMVSALVTETLQSLAPAYRPRLLYVGIPAGRLPPVPEMAGWAETDPKLLNETLRYTPEDLEAAKAAVQCHVTQFDETMRGAMMPLFDATMWQGKVHFRPAF
ncbi:PIG-L deacetylase family protein [Porphyrobacter sp. YT40]|uniref:PIG-L deacetylase family protein n=1 Tax=Porphyrobacter sp. YT40 TaxID=2547601 RepID=UPI0015E884D2|nr:PIG-L deacetylase family protein [Porphyrobacter sp. YT40]